MKNWKQIFKWVLVLNLMLFSTVSFADTETGYSSSSCPGVGGTTWKTFSVGTSGIMTGSLQNNTNENDYFKIQIAQSGTLEVNVSVDNSSQATNFYLLSGNTCGTTVDSETSTVNGALTANVTAGTTYYIRVYRDGNVGNYTMSFLLKPNYAIGNHRPFTMAYTANEKGNIKIIGNSVLTTATGCTTLPNNSVSAVNADQDSDGTTFNSTSATLTLPAGVTGSDIAYAGLYWQARLQSGTISSQEAQARTVKLKLPGGSYQTITSNPAKFNWSKVSGHDDYQGVFNITTLIQGSVTQYATASGYSQPIWVANVLARTGTTNLYGAWSIVLVYKDGTTTLKNLSVYDGYLGINTSTPAADSAVTLSGFLTPNTYPVNASFLIFGGEGDKYYGDSVTLSNSSGDRPLKSTGDVFDSTITDATGSNVATRNPACPNTLGADIHSYNIGKINSSDTSGIIATGQSTTTVKLSSFTVNPWPPAGSGITDSQANSYDTFFPGVFAFATDLYEPDVCYVENIFQGTTNISGIGARVNKDENLTVRVYIKNKGAEAASGVSIVHQFDSSFPYVENSANYNNSNPAEETVMPPSYARTTATDTAGDDLYEYNSATLRTKINLGTLATSGSGGTFTPNDTTAVFEYSATVKILDSNYSNEYKAGYVNSVLGVDYTNNPVAISSCDGSRNSFWGYYLPPTSGEVDIVDPQNVATYTTAPVIKTKIANQPSVTLSVINLDPDTLQPENFTQSLGGFPLEAFLYRSSDALCTDELPLAEPITGSPAGQPVIANIAVGSSWANTNSFTMRSVASDITYIKAKFADWSVLLGGLTNSSSCFANSNTSANFNGLPQCLNTLGANSGVSQSLMNAYPNIGTTCINQTGGTYSPCDSNAYDNDGSKGGIYPTKYDHAYGCLACILDAIPEVSSCSTDNFAIRPDTYATTVSPNGNLVAGEDFNLTAVAKGYNTSAIAGAYDGSAALSPLTQLVACEVDDGNITNNANASASPLVFDGVDTNISNNIKFGDVGVFDINITDSTWSAVDSVKSPAECIVGSNTNVADANGTIGCDVRVIFTKTVIPDHFDVNGTLSNGSNGFTYLHNNDSNATLDQNISAILNSNVTAKSALDGTTRNYAGDCYAKNGNSTLALSFNPAITPVGSLNNGLWYDDVNNSNTGSSFAIGTAPTINHPKERFASGVGNLRYRLNFDRNVTQSVNPFMMTISDMAVIDTDGVDGNNSIDNNATYVYGRTHASKQRYSCTTSPCGGNANIYFESFCFGAGCDKNLLPNGLTSKRTDDARWFWNELHNIANDGNVSIVVQKGGVNTNADIVTATDNPLGNPSVTTLNYNGSRGYPYRTTMQNGASPWLIYNESDPTATRNEFQVEFNSQGDWTGEHNTSTTTKSDNALRTNRRIMW